MNLVVLWKPRRFASGAGWSKAQQGLFSHELRLNGDDFQEGGLTLADYIEVAKLVNDKVDLLIFVRNHEDPAMFCRIDQFFFPRGPMYLARDQKHVTKPAAK
ncbi:MAG: hypothetical protein ACLRMZ_00345 [Blautia marasmi]